MPRTRQLLPAHRDQGGIDVFLLALEREVEAAAPALADQGDRPFLAAERQTNFEGVAIELVDPQRGHPFAGPIRDGHVVVLGHLRGVQFDNAVRDPRPLDDDVAAIFETMSFFVSNGRPPASHLNLDERESPDALEQMADPLWLRRRPFP